MRKVPYPTPGEILREEFLKPLGLSAYRLAKDIGVSQLRISQILGGKRAIMEQLAPLGPVYQAGTLSGNPVATACGLATLKEISQPGFFDALSAKTRSLVEGLSQAARKAGVAFSADCEGGMFGFFLLPELPQNYGQVMKSDGKRFNQLFHGLLDRGVYIAPALYEAGFVSAAHTAADVQALCDALIDAGSALA